jgi:tetratricopeptide (TPR) repeat protein
LKDAQGYRECCGKLLAKDGDNPDARTRNLIAWTCAIAPGAIDDPQIAVRFAEQAVATDPRNGAYLNTLAAALYRADRFKDAAETLQQIISTNSDRASAADFFFLALVNHRRGDTERAGAWLAKGVESVQRRPSSVTSATPWHERLEFDLLHNEAKLLLQNNSK